MTNFGANDQDRIDGDTIDGDAMGTRGEETRLIASLRWIVFIFKYQ
jgi:hypothetical protein